MEDSDKAGFCPYRDSLDPINGSRLRAMLLFVALPSISTSRIEADGSLARRRFGRVHFAGSFKFAGDFNTEVAQYRRARLTLVVVEKKFCGRWSTGLAGS
jgi:hypothetical protein